MHTEEDFTDPPRRRLGALALFRNPIGDILLVEKSYRSGRARWGLPGGCAKQNEPVPVACQREVLEETGLHVVPGRVLVLHHVPANGTSAEGINAVFDGGVLDDGTSITLSAELTSYRWVPPASLDGMVAPYTAWRITSALRSLTSEEPGVPLLVGHGPGAP
ncbi:NUDIX domain-containing protein [Streptomyces specialis]|uniref:NUDIX domain-containing protein n=1 Tax=Streptomyces specialis TaxID=498367 RepID=UPI00073F81C7|nr:NUDIX hydrolase [Streptomyces specialis]